MTTLDQIEAEAPDLVRRMIQLGLAHEPDPAGQVTIQHYVKDRHQNNRRFKCRRPFSRHSFDDHGLCINCKRTRREIYR